MKSQLQVQQLFENLFKNAIKHGGEDVTITVGELECGFYVKDDGEGISPEVKNKIFESGVTTEESGTGYGLKIVSQIIDAHDWNIDIDHSASGAKFNVTNVDPLTTESKEQQVA
jgi:signal transduction histidine kinase